MKKMMMLSAGLIALCAVFTGCSKDALNNLTQEESRIYITNYDSTINFKLFKTYSIADSVAVINNGQLTKENTPTDSAYITAVKKYMQQKGYTLVNKNQSPDLGVDVNRIYNTSTGIIDYGDYWDTYGGYWDPYYWGYGGYGYYTPYSYGVYQITEGAMSIDMLDLKDAATKSKINVIWTGLIRGSGIFNTSVADAQVEALFNQSTYLGTN